MKTGPAKNVPVKTAVKSEPDCFSIDHLKRQHRAMDRVRNYQARISMRRCSRRPRVLLPLEHGPFPASPGSAWWRPRPIPTDPVLKKSHYYDPKATREQPRWDMVDVRFERKFKNVLALSTLKANEDRLEGLACSSAAAGSRDAGDGAQARELLRWRGKRWPMRKASVAPATRRPSTSSTAASSASARARRWPSSSRRCADQVAHRGRGVELGTEHAHCSRATHPVCSISTPPGRWRST